MTSWAWRFFDKTTTRTTRTTNNKRKGNLQLMRLSGPTLRQHPNLWNRMQRGILGKCERCLPRWGKNGQWNQPGMQAEIAKEAFITKDLERIKTCLETNMLIPSTLDAWCAMCICVCVSVCVRVHKNFDWSQVYRIGYKWWASKHSNFLTLKLSEPRARTKNLTTTYYMW